MYTSFKNIFVRIVLPILGIALVVVGAVCGYNAINNQATETRSQQEQQMVVAPVATATPVAPAATPAPAATATPEPPAAEATPAPVAVASSAGAPEVPSTNEDESILTLSSSSELQLVGQTNSGKPYTRLIRKEDLPQFGQYRIVKVLDWTAGVELAFNSERVLGKFWGMKMPRGYAAKDMPSDFGHDPQREWLNADGSLRGSNARNGWDKSGRSAGRILFLNDLFVVEKDGLQYWVVEGNPAAPRSGSGSSSSGSGSSNNGSTGSNGSSGTTNNGGSQRDPALTIPNDGHLSQSGQEWLDGGKDNSTNPTPNGGITIGNGGNNTPTPTTAPANDGITIGGNGGKDNSTTNGGITIGNGGSSAPANDGITIGGAVSQPEADSALTIGGNTDAQPRLTIGGGATVTDGITIGQ